MRIAVTGFVGEESGSIAAANALILRWLLNAGIEITFFSKASFVDPRPAVQNHPGLHFVDTDNRMADRFRGTVSQLPILSRFAAIADSASYNRLLVRRMREAHVSKRFDLCLWLGDYARGRIPGIPSVSFVQGAPGSDARSIIRHYPQIVQLGGRPQAWKLRLLAKLRLSPLGLPPFHFSDHFIVGSSQSKNDLTKFFGIDAGRISTLPYPVDLEHFSPNPSKTTLPGLGVLWLGRIIPRKRLDLFLDGAAEAIQNGLDLHLTVVGRVGLVSGYQHLLESFPFPERLHWIQQIPRQDVPALLANHDVLVQPSEEEDFGSSVAEAQACGLRVVVGTTSGNRDYLSVNDLVLADYSPRTLAKVLIATLADKSAGNRSAPLESRRTAEKYFSLSGIGPKFLHILYSCKQ